MSHKRDKIRRRNHFIAATYLSPFSSTGERNGLLFEYRRSRLGPALRTTPNAVATEKDLYVRPGPSGENEDSVERFFATEIEAPFGPVRDRLIRSTLHGLPNPVALLAERDMEVLTNYVLTQQMRTPVEREAIEWMGQLGARDIVRNELTPGSRSYDVWKEVMGGEPMFNDRLPQLERALQEIAQATLKTRKSWITISIRLSLRMAAIVRNEFQVRIVTVPADVELVTCDMPLVCAVQNNTLTPTQSFGGWQEQGFEAMIALSPRHFLHLTKASSDSARLFSRELALWLRRATLANANEAVYSIHESDDISETLRDTPRPVYYFQVEDRQYPVGHNIDDVDAHIRASGVQTIGFRYGPLRVIG